MSFRSPPIDISGLRISNSSGFGMPNNPARTAAVVKSVSIEAMHAGESPMRRSWTMAALAGRENSLLRNSGGVDGTGVCFEDLLRDDATTDGSGAHTPSSNGSFVSESSSFSASTGDPSVPTHYAMIGSPVYDTQLSGPSAVKMLWSFGYRINILGRSTYTANSSGTSSPKRSFSCDSVPEAAAASSPPATALVPPAPTAGQQLQFRTTPVRMDASKHVSAGGALPEAYVPKPPVSRRPGSNISRDSGSRPISPPLEEGGLVGPSSAVVQKRSKNAHLRESPGSPASSSTSPSPLGHSRTPSSAN